MLLLGAVELSLMYAICRFRVLEFVLDSLLYNVSINMNINDETIGRFVLVL